MQNIIKEEVKEQDMVQVSNFLPRIEQTVNEQLEAEVLTRSSHSSKASYAVVADLSEMELKKILIEKMEGTYESDKIILDTYKETVMLKRRRDDYADKDEEPFAGPDQGSKRRSKGKEPKSISAPMKTATRSAGRSTQGSRSRQMSASESATADYLSNGRACTSRFYGFAVNRESARDVYSKRRIIAVTELKIVEWHNYKYLDWITVRRDADKLYKFKEGDFKRLRIQDIEDMLLLLVQGKLTNLTVEERFAFNVSLRMFTRSIVIQRRMEDLQLGVKSYQKKLNLTKPDTYRSDLSDGTLIDVHTALDDRLKGIRMQYLPQSIWGKGNKDRAVAMIHAIDKRLKTRRIMRSLKRFVRGRLYEGDFKILQRTI
nr:hypothetical protein [Tanacetum cinerariifolium]